MQHRRGLHEVERLHRQARVVQLVVRARLTRQAQDTVAAVRQRPFQGDQVQPVAHRVDEQHVAAHEAGERTRVVVALVEDHRIPPRGPPALVHAGGGLLDLVAVGEVFGQRLARGIEEGRERHALAQLRMLLEQEVVREEAAHDVLRQLHPVDAHDQLPVTHPLLQRCDLGVDLRSVDLRGEHRGIRAERRRERVTDRRVRAQDLLGRGAERACPALGVEPGRAARHGRADRVRDVLRQHAHRARPAEGGVGEVDDVQVGRALRTMWGTRVSW